MSEDSLRELQAKVIAFRDARDWSQFHDARSLATALAVEAAELLEIFNWTRDAEVAGRVAAEREHLEEELADVAILLLTLAHDAGVELGGAVERKLEKNARKYPVETSRGRARPEK